MEVLNWCGKEWRSGQPWGNVHPEHTRCHYSNNQVMITNEDILVLGATREPKVEFIKGNRTEVPIAVGLISSIKPVLYGEFSIEARLPKSPNMHPAFWLFGSEDHPPEIDIFEGYSGDRGDYFKFRFLKPWAFWNVQTNAYYKDYKGKDQKIRPRTHWLGFDNPMNVWNHYYLKWTPDEITIKFNGVTVRRVTDREVLDDHNEPMHVVINNMITQGYQKDRDYWDCFYVRNFQYKPCN